MNKRLARPLPRPGDGILIRADEAAQILGLSLNRIYDYAARNLIPGIRKMGKAVYFAPEPFWEFALGSQGLSPELGREAPSRPQRGRPRKAAK